MTKSTPKSGKFQTRDMFPKQRPTHLSPLIRNRVYLEAMQNAIYTAQERFPAHTIVVLVDQDGDTNERAFTLLKDVPHLLVVTGENAAADLAPFDPATHIFICGFNNDDTLCRYLDYLHTHNGLYFCSRNVSAANYWHLSRGLHDLLLEERTHCKTHGHENFMPDQLANIAQAIDLTRHLDGAWLEVGVFTGTSARFTYRYITSQGLTWPCYFLDSFDGFAYPAASQSRDAFWHGTHPTTDTTVRQRLTDATTPTSPSWHVHTHNIITDDLPDDLPPLVGANIDVDLYEAVDTALRKIIPRLQPGGIAIVQDAGRTPLMGGARLALNQFLTTPLGKTVRPIYLETGQTFLLK